MTDDAGALERWLLPRGHGTAERAVAGELGTSRRGFKEGAARARGPLDGQLYRWKRMGRIPEDWFIRRATYTGQQTFFLRRLILERIETIQCLKDRYSLEKIAELLSSASSGQHTPWMISSACSTNTRRSISVIA